MIRAGWRYTTVLSLVGVVSPSRQGRPVGSWSGLSGAHLLPKDCAVGECCPGGLLTCRRFPGPRGLRAGRRRLATGHTRQPQDLPELLLDGGGDVRMVLEILLGVFASLANAVLLVRIPGAAFVHEAFVAREILEVPLAGDADPIHHVKLRLAERRRHFVLHHLGPYAAADHLVPIFDLADPPDIQADGGIKFQGIAPVVVSGLPTNMPIFCRS